MFYWTKYRYHGNTAGNTSSLNIGLDLFSENPVDRFFPSLVSRKLNKILAYTGLLTSFDREIFCYFEFCILTFPGHVLCQIQFLFAGELRVF